MGSQHWVLWLIWRDLRHALVLVLFTAPLLGVSFAALYLDPVLRQFTGQNTTLSPPPWDYLLGLGLPALLSLVGLMQLGREGTILTARYRGLLVTWLCVGALLLYLPVGFQRRLIEGLQAPVVALAVAGLYSILPRRLPAVRRLTVVGVLALSVPTSLFLLVVTTAGVLEKPWFAFPDRPQVRAMEWLHSQTSPDSVVLAGPEAGGLIPALAGNRVFYGHPFETIRRPRQAPGGRAGSSAGAWDRGSSVTSCRRTG